MEAQRGWLWLFVVGYWLLVVGGWWFVGWLVAWLFVGRLLVVGDHHNCLGEFHRDLFAAAMEIPQLVVV